jgi:glycosyltransferase involved in cell wall biosynthesis
MGDPLENRVSVILPTFNRADLISETIDSLLVQTRKIDEILVIDDGSTDDTAARVAVYGDKVRYCKKENGGKAAALNLGLTMIDGEFVWVCDDDDLILPDACERLMREFESDPTLEYCAGGHQDFYCHPGSGQRIITTPSYVEWTPPNGIFSSALEGCNIWQPGLIVRRSAYEKVGLFNEALMRSQDYEMLLRLTRHCRGMMLQEPVFLHRDHNGDRGSAAERFPIEEANLRWIGYNREIILTLLDDLSDRELFSDTDWAKAQESADQIDRIGKIRRGAILGRHAIWSQGIDVWSSIDDRDDAALTAMEIGMIKGATTHSLSCSPLIEPEPVAQAVKSLKSHSAIGRQIVKHLGASLLWRVKKAALQGKIGEVWRLSRFIAPTL